MVSAQGPDWDASTYDRVADPMTRWGTSVLARLELEGHETVLDAGCGSGRVTEQLLERLPRGHVVALDASPAMIEEARRRLAAAGDRLSFVVADLMEPLPLASPVDAVFSTATFHWVPDHERLYGNLAAVLRSGGQLVAQAGGGTNVAAVIRVVREIDPRFVSPWCYPFPEDEKARLEAAGFTDVQVWLQPEPTPIEPGEPMETYLRTIILRDHLARFPDAEASGFVARVARAIPDSTIDYVRLNIVARRR